MHRRLRSVCTRRNRRAGRGGRRETGGNEETGERRGGRKVTGILNGRGVARRWRRGEEARRKREGGAPSPAARSQSPGGPMRYVSTARGTIRSFSTRNRIPRKAPCAMSVPTIA
eukprot:3031530-Rhodomonas_salina.2